jgi:DNA-binding transcriptional regulator GbsR (MarR family)
MNQDPSNKGERVPGPYQGAILEIAALLGDLIEFWGFRRPLGQIWTWLYFSPVPQSAVQLQEALGLSAGTVSTTLKELRHWGVVRLVPRPGKNADVFVAEHDVLPILLKVLRERELELISRAIRVLEAAAASAQAGAEGSFFAQRVFGLLNLTRAGYQLLSALLSLRAPDFEGLRRALFL